jgi:hypothetical protein
MCKSGLKVKIGTFYSFLDTKNNILIKKKDAF